MRKFRLSRRKISYIAGIVILLFTLINQLIEVKKPTLNISPTPTQIISSSTSSAQLIKVSKVIDGDTIQLENGQTVRYIGIDTPELHHPKKKLQCFGKEAKEKNKELVEGKLVKLEKDISETDRYWRLLRYVFVPTTASPSGEFVNEILVREGYAYAATFPPDVKYSEYLISLENQARENNRGLWNKCQ